MTRKNVAYVLYEFIQHFSIKPVSTNRDTTNPYATQLFTVEAILHRDATTFTKMTWVHVCEQGSGIARFVQTSNSLFKNNPLSFQKILRLRRRLLCLFCDAALLKTARKLKGALLAPSFRTTRSFDGFCRLYLCWFVCRLAQLFTVRFTRPTWWVISLKISSKKHDLRDLCKF